MQVSLVALFAAVTGVAMASPMSLHNIRSCDLTSKFLPPGYDPFAVFNNTPQTAQLLSVPLRLAVRLLQSRSVPVSIFANFYPPWTNFL